ncbi:MAG: hypothetical protein ABIF01_03030 [Candidatus Micrarchaeota archaeon]
MIDREVLWRARREGLQRQFMEMRRNIEYQQILCPACHAHIHEDREREHFFPNYNLNTSGNNVKLALESQMKVKVKTRG